MPGLASPTDTPDAEQLLVDTSDDLKDEIVKQANQFVPTINPAVI